jgi:hypothetical protein
MRASAAASSSNRGSASSSGILVRCLLDDAITRVAAAITARYQQTESMMVCDAQVDDHFDCEKMETLPLMVFVKRFARHLSLPQQHVVSLRMHEDPELIESIALCWNCVIEVNPLKTLDYLGQHFEEHCNVWTKEVNDLNQFYSLPTPDRMIFLNRELFLQPRQSSRVADYIEHSFRCQPNIVTAMLSILLLLKPVDAFSSSVQLLLSTVSNLLIVSNVLKSLCANACSTAVVVVVVDQVIHRFGVHCQNDSLTKGLPTAELTSPGLVLLYIAEYNAWAAATIRDRLTERRLYTSVCVHVTTKLLHDATEWMHSLLGIRGSNRLELKSDWILSVLSRDEICYFGSQGIEYFGRLIDATDSVESINASMLPRETILSQLLVLQTVGLASNESLVPFDFEELHQLVDASITSSSQHHTTVLFSQEELAAQLDWIFVVVSYCVASSIAISHTLASATNIPPARTSSGPGKPCCLSPTCSLLCTETICGQKPCKHFVTHQSVTQLTNMLERCGDTIKLCYQQIDRLQQARASSPRHESLRLYVAIMISCRCSTELLRHLLCSLNLFHVADLMGGSCMQDHLVLHEAHPTVAQRQRNQDKKQQSPQERSIYLPTMCRLPSSQHCNPPELYSDSTKESNIANAADSIIPSTKFLVPISGSSIISERLFVQLASICGITKADRENGINAEVDPRKSAQSLLKQVRVEFNYPKV